MKHISSTEISTISGGINLLSTLDAAIKAAKNIPSLFDQIKATSQKNDVHPRKERAN